MQKRIICRCNTRTVVRSNAIKTIGLIGGMSWVSSLDYYRYLNELTAERLGGLHSARVAMHSVDFAPIEIALREGRWQDVAAVVGDAGAALKRAGADFLVIACNTVHRVAGEVAERAGLPLIDIRDATAAAIAHRGLRAVGLVGTPFVMQEAFYSDRLRQQAGLEVLVPDSEGIATIHRIIIEELCHGIVTEASRGECLAVIDGLVRRGAEGVVLGCTELPLLIRQGDADVPMFDTARLHAAAAVDRALAE